MTFPMDVIFDIFDASLPRQGPGSNAATRRAWALLGAVPPCPMLLDIGCGSGMQTLELARLSRGRIIALDMHFPYLAALHQRAAHENLSAHINPVNGSMEAMMVAPGTFDMIWSEGALYFLGFEQGLEICRPLLKPDGYLVVSELTWFTPEPAPELVQFWQEEQADIRSVEDNLQRIAQAGYRCLGHFPLPQAAWWDDFFGPVEQRLAALRQKYRDDPDSLAVVEQQQREIDLYRIYADQYGYAFYAMQVQAL